MICPNCSTENPPAGTQCVRCGVALPSAPAPVPDLPPLPTANTYQASTSPGYSAPSPTELPAPPPTVPYMPPNYATQAQPVYPPQYEPPRPETYLVPDPLTPSILDTIIPSHNPKALMAYYLGIFSFIPLLGIFLGIAAFIFGLQGLKAANQTPAIKGKTHAWIGILVGGLFGFGYLILTILIIILSFKYA